MTELSTLELPSAADRRIRIAFLVINDTYGDTRVLKTAETAVQAGAEVRIFAIGGRKLRFPAGLEVRPNGVEIERYQLRKLTIFSDFLARWRARPTRDTAPPASPHSNPAAQTRVPAESLHAPTWVPTPRTPAATGGSSTIRATASVVKRVHKRFYRVLRPLTKPLPQLFKGLDGRVNRHAGRAEYYTFGIQPLVAAWAPDLIHAHDANTLTAAGRMAKKLGIPFVYDSHELWTQRNRPKTTLSVRVRESLNERRWARRAARVITVSPSIATWLRTHYRLREMPELVRNIPPSSGILPSREGGRLRELAGLRPSDKVVVYCGGITTNRGIESAIEAVATLPQGHHLVLLGYTNHIKYEEGLRKLVEEQGLSDRVHFVGKVPSEEVSAALADADVSLVLTQPTCLSYAYSLPNKLFESVHAGIPIVSTDLVDAAALIEHYGVGETVAVGADTAELAARIKDVIARSGEFRASAARAASELTWVHEADRLVAVWARALGVTPQARAGEATHTQS